MSKCQFSTSRNTVKCLTHNTSKEVSKSTATEASDGNFYINLICSYGKEVKAVRFEPSNNDIDNGIYSYVSGATKYELIK